MLPTHGPDLVPKIFLDFYYIKIGRRHRTLNIEENKN